VSCWLNVFVQGKIHIEIEFGENRGRLGVRLNEACELAITNGNCDPFADVTVRYTNDKTETQRTKVKKKTNSPVFDEAFAFTVMFDNICTVYQGKLIS